MARQQQLHPDVGSGPSNTRGETVLSALWKPISENEIRTVPAHRKYERPIHLVNKCDALPVSIVVQGAANENRVL